MNAVRVALLLNVAVFLGAGLASAVVVAQPPFRPEPRAVSQDEIKSTVERLGDLLRENYVYPEKGEEMAADIARRLQAGEYANFADDVQFAERLTQDLRAISNDKHLGVIVAPPGPGGSPVGAPPPGARMVMRGPNAELMRRENYGFRRAEVLDNNIGYLRLDIFIPSDEAMEAAAGALAFLANVDALVIDLRYNRGGSPEMIRFLTSYFFEEPTLLNEMVDRNGDVVDAFHTLESIPGRRFSSELPIYILTSKSTFSGAEEFAYNLQNLDRAVLIGETTGGGAHPVRMNPVNERFGVRIPFMRARNPISGTNWEGTGVKPHIEVPADQALDRAIQEAQRASGKRAASSQGN